MVTPESRASEWLLEIYRRLYALNGPQHWWPGESSFEVVVGAILTQAAAWSNVEKAIANLRNEGLLNPQGLLSMPVDRLSQLVYPSGYFNAKARKLKAFVEHLHLVYGGELDRLFAQPVADLRRDLLSIHGIGPETADSIILYAAAKPSFVVDAYTGRILSRLGLVAADASYDQVQALFMAHLPAEAALFNEYHALLVRLGKETCRRRPLCAACPLLPICPTGRALPPPP